MKTAGSSKENGVSIGEIARGGEVTVMLRNAG